MTRFCFIISILLPLFAQSQQKNSISGKILDEKGNPISSAHVQVDGKVLGTTTDANGSFTIHGIQPDSISITVTHISFLSYHQVLSTTNQALTITLKVDQHMLPQLYVVSDRDQLFSKTPGSVAYVDDTQLTRIQPINGNEVFRRLPGINVVDEEGAGLRINLGIRGLDPDRSRNVLMMEDGIPIALNPYGEPEMYYTPAIDRMSGVEVLKGSGQILYGPQTIGGVVNYITAAPPEEEEIGIKFQGGSGGYWSALGSYGNTVNKTGVQFNYLHKQADALGTTRFNINDVTAKIKFSLSEKSTIGLKAALYREVSNATYVGITQRMYDIGGDDFSVLMPNDELDVSRYLLSISHNYQPSKSVSLQSTVYGYTTSRNWRRQDYSYNTFTNGIPDAPPANWTGVVWGDESVAGGAIYLRDQTGNRDRRFEVVGWEQKLNYKKSIGTISNELISGYRFLCERAYEQRINGSTASALSGALVNDEIRTGKALAFYLLDKVTISEKWDITPGVRGEFYNYEREILREASVDVYKVAENTINEFIPGIGLNYRPTSSINLFGGIHRGYAPPRIKDAIDFSAANPVLQLEAEESWNVELGTRTLLHTGFFADVTCFYMDFDNQIIPSSQSVGGSGFGLTNAGRTIHYGVEASLNLNSRELLNTIWQVNLDVNATYVKAQYNSDRLITSGTEQVNVNGNQLPYAPQYTISTTVSLEAPFGTGLSLTHTYVDEQYADELNTITPSNNGRIGKIASYSLINATVFYKIPAIRASINISGKNLADERYISTRRPEGIRVGIPRFITAGFEIKF